MRRRQILSGRFPGDVNWAVLKTPAEIADAATAIVVESLPVLSYPCPYCDRKFVNQGGVNLHARHCKAKPNG